jgi:primosomal protein N' (replication factor Y)
VSTEPPRFAEVAVTLPVRGRFHYAVPEHLRGQLAVGHRVLVPFGSRRVTGFVLDLPPELPEDVQAKLRPIASRMDEAPLIPQDILQLATFAADYYQATVGEVLKLALPPGLTAASVVRLVATPVGRRWLEEDAQVFSERPELTGPQRELLVAAAQGQGVKGAKARSRAADALEALGLVARKESFTAHEGEATVEVAVRALAPPEAWPLIRRAPARRELYARLERGPVPVAALVASLGGATVRGALKRLVADGVVRLEQAPAGPGAQGEAGHEAPPEPTPEQAEALASLLASFDSGAPGAFLLQGVTGSGKTEVYLRLIAHALAGGRGAVVLVPEIALTPQLEARFRARFGDQVVVLHSALTDAERRRGWRRLRAGDARIALGPRSALWAPVEALGVIVVDEEHDPSFKQGSDVRYNGRDLALVRASRTRSLVLLGSATPSLETLHRVEQGRLQRLSLAARVGARPLPKVQVVDLTEERRQLKGELPLLSRALSDGLRRVVASGEQAILFLNRRGFNTIVYCDECGAPKTCPRCSVSLTHHLRQRKLACHYCGFEEPLEVPCRQCQGQAIRPMGAGTERVVAAVKEEVPGARVLRLDRDATQKVGVLEETLRAFRAHEADVLVGTQMVAKGHDFPRVTLVGIVLADASLAFPDFRAAERTFQLLTQVAGRAGRADAPGRVVVQTFQPQHYALLAAVKHDVQAFLQFELPAREEAGYPPYGRMGLVRVESRDQAMAEAVAARAAEAARGAPLDGGRVLGPAPAPIDRLRERWRFQVLVLTPSPARLLGAFARVRGALEDVPRKVDVVLDVDPMDLL